MRRVTDRYQGTGTTGGVSAPGRSVDAVSGGHESFVGGHDSVELLPGPSSSSSSSSSACATHATPTATATAAS